MTTTIARKLVSRRNRNQFSPAFARVLLLILCWAWISPLQAAPQLLPPVPPLPDPVGSLIVTMTSPASGSTVKGPTPVSATVRIVGSLTVQGVQFKLDGNNLGSEDTSAPYSVSWDTITAKNGSHTLMAVARDLANLQWSSNSVTVTVSNPPTITSFTPTSGLVGTSVTINGTNFSGATAVRFNGTTANYAVNSATVIQATVPANATSGSISVTTPGGTATSSSAFTVLSPPTITSFTPTSGLVGTSVTINSTNFSGATAVRFNGTTANYTVNSPTVIQATVPANATTGSISVTTPGGTATSSSAFTVLSPPTITSFTPTSGLVGASVTINGTNFSGATAVRFNGTTANYTVNSPTVIQATVPANATSGSISVTTPGGTATSSSAFTVLSPPTITSFTPTSGLVGTSVTINGTNFNGATAVRFNGTTANYTVNSATVIHASVPANATTGSISVTTPGGTATSSSAFTVLYPPTITSFTPTSGLVGASVTINGTNFSGATAVRFNGTTANYTVNSSTVIQASVPANATTGSIGVTTPGGTATSSSAFTVLSPPTITSFTPTSGLVGASVTINGTNFSGATAVRFNGTTANYTVNSSTVIQASVPANATTGSIGVTTPGGTATSSSAFTVLSPPTITSFTPTSGLVGASVTINGTNFSGATAVQFNGTTANYTVNSSTVIQATVPANATTGSISVTTPGGTATSSSAFTVLSPPTITSFTPTSGLVGTSVTINSTNFSGATAVRFNGTTANYTVNSPTVIQATVPANATTGSISVTTPGGTATSSSAFTVLSPPTITSFTPTSGLVGTSVTINSTNFSGATAVRFNGTTANYTVNSPTVIQATVPANATTGSISVTTPGGTATSSSAFTVLSPPTITSFTPTSGLVGTSVTINSTNFSGATAVRFNGTTANYTVNSPTVIQATVPANATSASISVTAPGGTATSSSAFTVLSPPTITSLTPHGARADLSVTINGTNFSGATAVQFNGTTANYTVNSSTVIQATVPANATSGSISVTTPAGTATSSSAFTVLSPPTITSFTPTSGLVGTSVTINGTNFSGATAVQFNGTTANYTVNSSTVIQATVPANATTGSISVTTPAGTATSSSPFTVINPPTITSFSPTMGPVGTSVSITGTDLNGATVVQFNGVSATFTVNSPTSIQATVPAPATAGPISVSTPGGTGTSSTPFNVATRFENTDAALRYTSGWDQNSTTRPWSGGTAAVAPTAGQQVTFTFTGTDLRWIGFRGPQAGIARVSLDGVFIQQIDMYSVAEEVQAEVFKATGLASGNHTLLIEVTGTSNPASTGTYVVVDAFDVAPQVPATVNITSPPSGATVSGTIMITVNASGGTVAGVQFRLDGANLGAEVTAPPYSMSWDTTKASSASHTLSAVARFATGSTASSSPVAVTVSNVPPGQTRFEDTDTSISYTAGWTRDSTLRAWSGGTAMLSTTAGDRP